LPWIDDWRSPSGLFPIDVFLPVSQERKNIMSEQILKGKVGVVIGASRNLGRSIAEMLGAEGAKVAVHHNSDSAHAGAEETAAAIKEGGGKASIFQADLTRITEVERLFDAVTKKFGHLDIMVNTAGMVLKKPLAEITEQEYDRLFAINAKAAFFCMQAAANQMSDDGRIVNVGTSLLAATTGFYSAYAGSKAPLEHFTRALAKEIGHRGITVNTIAPGPLNTSFFYPAETDDATEFHKSMSINGKLGEVKDIVPLVKLLVSPEGRWITAQTIFINGGYVAR
jgi:NAD(P)-dependent dehydrogenase (short-subunit alcohol dehydrogenase family)